MGVNDTEYGILIKATDQARAVIGQSIQQTIQYEGELKKLKQTADGTAASNAALGSAHVHTNAAIKAATSNTNELTSAQRVLKSEITGLTQGLASRAGPLGGLASSLVGINAGATLAVAGIGAVGTAVVLAGKAIGEFQERVDLIAQQTGLTTHEIGGLSLGAANVGRTFEQISPSLDIFVRHLADARDGAKDALAAFSGAGIKGGLDRSTGELLEAISRGLNAIEDPAKRAQAAFELFGGSWRQILPVISQDMRENSQTAMAWGISLSESAEKAARRTDVAWDRLSARMHGFTLSMQSDSATMSENFAKSAEEGIAILAKWEEALHHKYLVQTGTLTPSKSDAGFVRPLGGSELSPFPTDKSEAESAVAAQQKQIRAIEDQIAGMTRLREAGRLLVDDEIAQLVKLQDQAIAVSDRVVRERELLAIRKEIGALIDKEDVVRVELTRTPTQPGELLIPQYMKQGADLGTYKPFGEDTNKRLEKDAADFDAALKETVKSLGIAGSAETEFNNILKTHHAELADAYAESNAELNKHVATLARHAKLTAAVNDAMNAGMQQLASGAVEFFKSLFQVGGGSFWDKLGGFLFGIDEMFLKTLIGGAVPSFGGNANFNSGLDAASYIPKQDGGQWIGAQRGLAVSGIRGKDTIPVAMGKDEGIFDHTIMDQMRQFLKSPASYIAASSPSAATSRGADQPITINATFNLHTLTADKMQIRAAMTEHFIPAIRDLLPKGIVR